MTFVEYRPPLCPVLVCSGRLGSGMVMCRRHWRMVPRPLQSAFWAEWTTWREGRDNGLEMRFAWAAAVDAVEDQLAHNAAAPR